MIRRAFGEEPNLSDEDIETALNNIIVLARERAGVEALLEVGLLRKIKSLLEIKRPSKKELKWKILAVRSLSQLVQFDMKTVGLPFQLTTITSSRLSIQFSILFSACIWEKSLAFHLS